MARRRVECWRRKAGWEVVRQLQATKTFKVTDSVLCGGENEGKSGPAKLSCMSRQTDNNFDNNLPVAGGSPWYRSRPSEQGNTAKVFMVLLLFVRSTADRPQSFRSVRGEKGIVWGRLNRVSGEGCGGRERTGSKFDPFPPLHSFPTLSVAPSLPL